VTEVFAGVKRVSALLTRPVNTHEASRPVLWGLQRERAGFGRQPVVDCHALRGRLSRGTREARPSLTAALTLHPLVRCSDAHVHHCGM
jgi:hypothetical protein